MRTMLKSKTNKSSLKKKKQRNLDVSLRKGFKKKYLKNHGQRFNNQEQH